MTDDDRDVRTANLNPSRAQIDAPNIPGYRISEVLGEGGMGTVYAAMQDSPRRKVAIKILHRTSASAFLRFQTEVEVMARLDHPGIAHVFAAGDADGCPFLVMDFIEGKTLDDHVVDLGLRARLQLFVAVCDAVHHAHIKGVIHRDLKPTNVMVRAGERAVVLDFGVARLTDGSTVGLPRETREGELLGTPLYMSPEQARLRPDEVDARSDIYTLGVILYELACNEVPYEVPRGLPLHVLSELICEQPPVPLGKRDPFLHGDLEAIAATALAKEPRHRYQSVAALADDVRRYLDHLPVSVRMPGPIERTRRFMRRRPILAASIGAAVIGVVGFATIVTALLFDATAARRATEQAIVRTETARHDLEARTTELTLRQARSALTRDPTEALAWLATLPPHADVDARVAWMIADEARARGVATDVLRGHADEVHWIEPVGDGLVSAGYDGRVIVWNPAPMVVFTSSGRVRIARPSPDGAQIAIGGDHGTLIVIDRDGSHRQTLGALAGDVQKVEWSPDGAWLAAASDQGNVWLFDHGKGPGRELALLASKGGNAAVDALAFSTTSTVLLAGNEAGLLRRWTVASPDKLVEETLAHEVRAVWSDGDRVRAVDADGTIYDRWITKPETRELATGTRTKRVAFSPRGTMVVLGGLGGEVVRIHDGVSPVRLHTHRALVRSLTLSLDERWLASGGDDGSLVVYDLATNRQLSLYGHAGRIRDVAFSGTTLFSSDSEGTIRRWDLTELGTNVLATAGPAVQKLATNGTLVAAVDESGQLTRWSLVDGVRTELERIEGRVTALLVAGGVIVSGTAEGALGWHGGQPRPTRTMSGSPRAAALLGERIAVASSNGTITLYSRDGVVDSDIGSHAGGTDAIAASPNGTQLASGGQDRVIRIWQQVPSVDLRPNSALSGAGQIAELSGPQGDTHFVAYTPNNTRLVSAGNDGTVFGWSIAAGMPDPASRSTLAQHTGAVTALAVGNNAVVSAGRDLQLIRVTTSGDVARTTIATAAVSLALGPNGTVFALTRGGSVLRWEAGKQPVVEIDHGVVAATPIDESHWVLGFADGAVVVVGLGPASLGDLQARIAALTSFRLHSPVGTAVATPPASGR